MIGAGTYAVLRDESGACEATFYSRPPGARGVRLLAVVHAPWTFIQDVIRALAVQRGD